MRRSSQGDALARLLVALLITAWTLGAQAGDHRTGEPIDAEAGPSDYQDLSLEDLLNTTVSVSSHRREVVFDTPSTVSVIDRATIELYGFTRVSEAISTLAGVSVVRTYLKRQLPTVRGILQDHYANKVLVLIDGVPAWMAVTGEGNIDRVSIDHLERIEVLKGPASVLYGTNAYSGAVNLVLRKQKKDGSHGRVTALGGYPGQLSGGGSYSYRGEQVSYFVAAQGGMEPGREYMFEGEAVQVDPDCQQGSDCEFAAERATVSDFLNTADLTMRVEARTGFGTHTLLANAYQSSEGYLGVVPQVSRGAGNAHRLEGYLGAYSYSVDLHKKVSLRLGGSFDWNHRDLSREGDDSVRSKITGYRGSATLGLDVCLARWLSFEVGGAFDHRTSEEYSNYDTQTDDVLAKNNLMDRSVWEMSALAQLRFAMEPLVEALPLTLLTGGRYTKNEFYNDDFSLRSTLVYRLADRHSLKLVAGQSYRAPTLFELYFETPSQTVFGSKDLSPESSSSMELAYLAGIGNFFAHVLGYWAKYDDKIFRVRDETNSHYVYANGDTFTAWGAELELMYRDLDLFDAFANYTFVRGDDGDDAGGDQTHYNFKYIPEHVVTVGLGKRYRGFFASTVLNYIHERGAPVETLDSQITWDLSLGYRGSFGHHTLSAKNLLDEDVRVPDYVRRKLNSCSSGFGRTVFYRFQYDF